MVRHFNDIGRVDYEKPVSFFVPPRSRNCCSSAWRRCTSPGAGRRSAPSKNKSVDELLLRWLKIFTRCDSPGARVGFVDSGGDTRGRYRRDSAGAGFRSASRGEARCLDPAGSHRSVATSIEARSAMLKPAILALKNFMTSRAPLQTVHGHGDVRRHGFCVRQTVSGRDVIVLAD